MAGASDNSNLWHNQRRQETNLPNKDSGGGTGQIIIFANPAGGPDIIPIPGSNGRIPQVVRIHQHDPGSPDYITTYETDTVIAELAITNWFQTNQEASTLPKHLDNNGINPLTANPGSITLGPGAVPDASVLIKAFDQSIQCFF